MNRYQNVPQPMQIEQPNQGQGQTMMYSQQVNVQQKPSEELKTTFDTSSPYSMESIFNQSPNPESDKEFSLSNLGIDLLSKSALLPSVYYVGSDAPMIAQGQYPSSIYFPQTSDETPPSNRIRHFNDFMLFFIFYVHTGDKLQLEASNELKKRNYSYDTDKKAWKNQSGKVFDPNTWKFIDQSEWGIVPRYN